MLKNLISYHDNFSKYKNSISRQPSGLPRLNYVCLCRKLSKMTLAFILFPKEMEKIGDFHSSHTTVHHNLDQFTSQSIQSTNQQPTALIQLTIKLGYSLK